jgi:hypothetical protein
MPTIFDKLGIQFLYPENWTLDEQDAIEGEAAVTVYSPEGAFWSVMLHPPQIDPKKLVLEVLAAMKEEFTDFEAEPSHETIEGVELSGYDMNFYCLDLTNTALVRGFRTADATCIVLYQAEDRDFASIEPVFRAMTISLLRAQAGHELG